MNKWQQVKLGEYCEITSSKRIFYSDYVVTGIPFFRSKEIIERRNGEEISEPLFISNEKYENIKFQFGVPQAGDMLLTSVGTIGIAYIVKKSDNFYFKDGNLTWFRNFSSSLYSQYLYYLMSSATMQGTLYNAAIGSSQKALTISALKQVKIPLPPIEVQRKIADVLSAYDDLIENNRKQIKLLEEAAQRLYKEWFIDLRFPGYENTPIIDGIPAGWEKKNLESIIGYEIGGGWGSDIPTNTEDQPGYVIRGTDINGITNGDILTVPFRYHAPNNLSSRILKHGDIIFEVSGGSRTEGVGKTLLITEQLLSRFNTSVICASFCKLIRADNSDLPYYLAAALKYWRSIGRIGEFEKKSASSIINYRWKDFLTQQKILLPSTSMMKKYNDIAGAIYNKIISLSLMIEKTKQTRDRLLPKLMNGELEVK